MERKGETGQDARNTLGVFEREHYSNYLSEETMLVAARNGRLDIVEWLYTELGVNPRVNLFGIYDYTAEKLQTPIDIAAANGPSSNRSVYT